MSSSSRKLGHGYSLALKTGSGTHCTLVYFAKCKRGFEQNLVKQIAKDYFEEKGLTHVDLTIGSEWGKRCVLIKGDLQKIQTDLHEIYAGKFDIDTEVPLHIDLRNQSDSVVIREQLPLLENWNH